MITHRDTVQMRDGTISHKYIEGELICFILNFGFEDDILKI